MAGGADSLGSGLLQNFIRNQHGELSNFARMFLMMTVEKRRVKQTFYHHAA